MILISFPHNPTTTVRGSGFLQRDHRAGARSTARWSCTISPTPISASTATRRPASCRWTGAKEVAVEIFSMSKSYNMAGWRVGFCLGNPKMIAALARIKSYLDYGVFQPIQIASIIALRECEEETKKICALYQKRRDVLVEGLRRAGWPVEPPKGSMFLWAPMPERYRGRDRSSSRSCCWRRRWWRCRPGIGFGPIGEGHVRFALIENEHRTRQATRGIKKFLKD